MRCDVMGVMQMDFVKGQWLGRIEGTNTGSVTLNLDEQSNSHKGIAYVWDDNPQLISYSLNVELNAADGSISGTAIPFAPIDLNTRQLCDWPSFVAQHPNLAVPNRIDISGKVSQGSLDFEWRSEIETIGSAHLKKGDADQPSHYATTPLNWANYKAMVLSLDENDFIFRGQAGTWRLRTSFHRNGRFDLNRYEVEDVNQLTRYFSAISSHVFNPSDPREHGALLSLAQHHGYPTPLLDWTASPFIAAFFAFDDVHNHDSDSVRVFALNRKKWGLDTPFALSIDHPELSLSVYEMMPIENDRMIPQQSITMFSNVDDIEQFISYFENKNGENYLTIFEMPKSERDIAMNELRKMGITYGSLFPGLDGACRELKEKYF